MLTFGRYIALSGISDFCVCVVLFFMQKYFNLLLVTNSSLLIRAYMGIWKLPCSCHHFQKNWFWMYVSWLICVQGFSFRFYVWILNHGNLCFDQLGLWLSQQPLLLNFLSWLQFTLILCCVITSVCVSQEMGSSKLIRVSHVCYWFELP